MLRKPNLSEFFMITINIVLIGSLIYLALYRVPEHQKQTMCWNYFLELKEEAGIYDIQGFISLNETEEIIKWGSFFNNEAEKDWYDRNMIPNERMCICVCNETE